MYTKYYRSTLLLVACTQMLLGGSGTIDSSYGQGGTSEIAIGRSNIIKSVALNTTDNSLVGVGTVSVIKTVSGACSFTSTGTLNTSFASNGYAELLIGSNTILQSIALQADGKAVAGGYAVVDGVTQFALARFNADGSLDNTFGGTGYVTTDVMTASAINAIVIQPSDGKIIAGGCAGQGAPGSALVRYNPDGTIDSSFGVDGIVFVNQGYTSSISALALQSDGSIIAAGFSWNFVTNECLLMRFNSNGVLDATFGTGGIVTTQFGLKSQATAVAVAADGSIVMGGYTTQDSFHYGFALARYTTNGILDLSFNGTGMVTTYLNYSSILTSLAIQSDGKIVAGGYDFGARATTFALARYLPSGAFDLTFGSNGIALTTIGSNAQINSLAIQSDGKIVAAGFSDDHAALARYLA
jgi:uncharacterized delta-60 repeat protein